MLQIYRDKYWDCTDWNKAVFEKDVIIGLTNYKGTRIYTRVIMPFFLSLYGAYA